MEIINGKQIAQKIIGELKKMSVPEKIFAAVLAGNNPASISFLKQKEKVAKELGIDFRIYKFTENSSSDFLAAEVRKIANLDEIGGIIVQLPLPGNMDPQNILNVIPAEKDVDVLGEEALGAFYNNLGKVLPPAVGVVEVVLQSVNCQMSDVKCAVVGLGALVGKPISLWLMRKCKDLYLLRKGSDFEILKQADLVITGTGNAGLIKPNMLKDGAGVIDFGYGFNDAGKISGDFDSSILNPQSSILKFYTPTPGGTGPILVAKLMENFYKLTT